MWVSAAVQIRSLYAAVQSTTFNYVCEWIWEKVNCSVKLGNGLFDVWGLITWHFYYSTRREGLEGWRGGGEEKERTNRVKVYLTSESDHQREYVYNKLLSGMVRRVLMLTSPRTQRVHVSLPSAFSFMAQNFTVLVQTRTKSHAGPTLHCIPSSNGAIHKIRIKIICQIYAQRTGATYIPK